MTPAAPAGSDAPIGVFDSGVGGLTVVRELMRQLPRENLLYFGDTARVPYGPKSPDTIRHYSGEIAAYLMGEGVKAVVVACNTATAHALPMLAAELPVPVIGVVEPGARAAVEASIGNGIGVIGTAGTIASGAYEDAIHAISPAARVVTQACPLFVPLVEEGWLDTDATKLIARQYLAPIVAAGVDTLVLGCTHYPLLAPVIAPIVGRSVRLIDSAHATAAAAHQAIVRGRLERPAADAASAATYRFVVSDAAGQFLGAGRRFLGSAIERVETHTFG